MEEIAYKDAVQELEEILEAIEQDEVDLDALAENVERASVLIRLCRQKIVATEEKVGKIISEMEPE